MAIDTQKKRMSVTGTFYVNGPGVYPNADQDQEWRQAVGYCYSGNAVGVGIHRWRRRRNRIVTVTRRGF